MSFKHACFLSMKEYDMIHMIAFFLCSMFISLPPLGLTLLGFKPKTKLKLHQYVKPANFIYPDESV